MGAMLKFAGNLLLLGVVIAACVFVSVRRHRIGPRATRIAALGLALFGVGTIVKMVWNLVLALSDGIPPLVSLAVMLPTALIMSAGVILTVVAAVLWGTSSRPPDRPPAPRSGRAF